MKTFEEIKSYCKEDCDDLVEKGLSCSQENCHVWKRQEGGASIVNLDGNTWLYCETKPAEKPIDYGKRYEKAEKVAENLLRYLGNVRDHTSIFDVMTHMATYMIAYAKALRGE